jgi:NAD(P) transhydrogenase subunit alpha
MVKGMHPGSVIVDLAAERGGNCEVTELDKTVVKHGVTIIGPGNLSSTVPFHASQMYSKNIVTFLNLLVKEGQLNLDMEDEIIRETLVAQNGEVVNKMVKEVLNNKK